MINKNKDSSDIYSFSPYKKISTGSSIYPPVRKQSKHKKPIKTKSISSHSDCHPSKCLIQTHSASGVMLVLPSDGAEQILFEDVTCNHNKTFFTLQTVGVGGSAAQPIRVTIRKRGCIEPIIIDLNPGVPIVIQVEDFASLAAANLSTQNQAILNLSFQKTFCICCFQEKKKYVLLRLIITTFIKKNVLFRNT